MIGSDQSFPTVGISFGLDVIFTVFELNGKVAVISEIDVFIIPMVVEKVALQLDTTLRQQGKRVVVELSDKKIRKAMDKANRENIPNVIVLGELEVKDNTYQLKNIMTGATEEKSYIFSKPLLKDKRRHR
ncbi:His/Gly/Thr/Pro-type tRNA ligase C-terminal domain-containing protein [Ureibacillus aquaedulcis]|uniref:His/Gly/Thr/Pro-type tRNA ligase C-terminal domain-containing protein n=1 Tax=Ureibacillus aquaedulcis TaxID=3058421 RepID=A0ABT8GVW7_9BACL|nr:His/Gly/Thr/Pro-type tRNA ligase C-terminal domain-containing protein [Ureibacillus sp. BA0131]MDN4495552.1 His/Gly/Thr/Pro-type tRNA ligase C-terminal domain-containing protein [Ureibacillus sp. BA0131]